MSCLNVYNALIKKHSLKQKYKPNPEFSQGWKAEVFEPGVRTQGLTGKADGSDVVFNAVPNVGRNLIPQIIHLNRVFHYKPSILGYHYFLETPI